MRIDTRGDVVINRVEGVEEKVAPIDHYLTSILKGGGGLVRMTEKGDQTD